MEKQEIYITNFWHTVNYGASLTAYALQNVLRQSNYKSELMNNQLKYEEITNRNCFSFDFQKKYLNIMKDIYKNSKFLDTDSKVFITGSDQVFRSIYTQGESEQYWLDFVKPDKKKIAFSASFGVDKEQFLKENSEEVIEHGKNAYEKVKNNIQMLDITMN